MRKTLIKAKYACGVPGDRTTLPPRRRARGHLSGRCGPAEHSRAARRRSAERFNRENGVRSSLRRFLTLDLRTSPVTPPFRISVRVPSVSGEHVETKQLSTTFMVFLSRSWLLSQHCLLDNSRRIPLAWLQLTPWWAALAATAFLRLVSTSFLSFGRKISIAIWLLVFIAAI